IVSLYIVCGASVQGMSSVATELDAFALDTGDLLVYPGRKMSSSILKGITVQKDGNGTIDFLIRRGDTQLSGEAKAADYQELFDYFKASLAIPDEFQWVNLSAYEADRMLPVEPSGTKMGRHLLAQDCMLKRLTASFMHPDSPVGREYWDAVYAETRRLFGS